MLDEVEHGETITIARNGTPVATLSAVRKPTMAERRAAFCAEHSIELRGLKIRDLIEEGRR